MNRTRREAQINLPNATNHPMALLTEKNGEITRSIASPSIARLEDCADNTPISERNQTVEMYWRHVSKFGKS